MCKQHFLQEFFFWNNLKQLGSFSDLVIASNSSFCCCFYFIKWIFLSKVFLLPAEQILLLEHEGVDVQ